MNIKSSLSAFWEFLKKDTWTSWIVSLILLAIFIKLIFFPLLSLATGTTLPLVIIESCSLYHESSFDTWWSQNNAWYEARNITKAEFKSFPFKNGLNKGDIMFVVGEENYKLGNIIIFNPQPGSSARNPVIHRIVSLNPIATKGDHNSAQLTSNNNVDRIDETNISPDRIIGKAAFKIMPLAGWLKLIWFEPFRPASQKGFCR